MITVNKNSSGALFVRYLTIGLIAIFSLIAFLNFSEIFLRNASIILGASIFVINLFTILGYTYAVLKDENLLAESDSPDLAYYLGFSLTVGALSATFIIDTLIGQNATASEKSDLIKNSLLQFGIGLTATLIGLCAKIYLSSKQSFGQTEPEEILRNFRQELNSFKNELQNSSSEFANILSESSKQLSDSVIKSMQSFQLLNETIINTNNEIKNQIGSDNFISTIDTFAKTISDLSKTTKDFVQENHKSIVSITEVVTTLNKLQSITETCIGKFEQVDKRYQEITISTGSLNQVTSDLAEKYKIVLPKTEQLSLVISNAVEAIAKLNVSVETSQDKFASGFGDTSDLMSFKQSLTKVGDELKKLESMIIRINNIKN